MTGNKQSVGQPGKEQGGIRQDHGAGSGAGSSVRSPGVVKTSRRIVALHPALSEFIELAGLAPHLVGVGDAAEAVQRKLPCIARPFEGSRRRTLSELLSLGVIDLRELAELAPDTICTIVPSEVDLLRDSSRITHEVVVDIDTLRSQLRGACENDALKLLAFEPRRLEQIQEMLIDCGRGLGVAAAGRDRAQRLKAQLQDWGENFYERTKSKRVLVLSGCAPLMSAGFWISDLIGFASAIPFESNPGQDDREITWGDIESFRPDVIVVAPRGGGVAEAIQCLPELERAPVWERLPAVKRGEVVFLPGVGPSLYWPGYGVLSGAAMLFSGMAGFESGYITERDSFFRLRYVELHRHRLLGRRS